MCRVYGRYTGLGVVSVGCIGCMRGKVFCVGCVRCIWTSKIIRCPHFGLHLRRHLYCGRGVIVCRGSIDVSCISGFGGTRGIRSVKGIS